MPLNQGVLDPVTNIVPEASFINPTGVVAISGSTISSQRLIDVILQAFKAAACSQGCASSTGFGESSERDSEPLPSIVAYWIGSTYELRIRRKGRVGQGDPRFHLWRVSGRRQWSRSNMARKACHLRGEWERET